MSIPRRRRPPKGHPVDIAVVEDADHCEWYKCDHCEHLHVVLLDVDSDPIATMVLSEQMLTRMLAVVNDKVQ